MIIEIIYGQFASFINISFIIIEHNFFVFAPNIDDTQCDIKVPQQFPSVKNIPDYGYFYKNLYFKSFRESAGVPWTGLGYTYDWGNKESEVGASEFIVTPHAPYEIKQVLSTHEYCAK